MSAATRLRPKGKTVALIRDWTIVGRLGSGGFGRIHEAVGESGERVALKVVARQAQRERESVLAGRLEGVPGVLGLIDHGQRGADRVLIMPRAARLAMDPRARPSAHDVSAWLESAA